MMLSGGRSGSFPCFLSLSLLTNIPTEVLRLPPDNGRYSFLDERNRRYPFQVSPWNNWSTHADTYSATKSLRVRDPNHLLSITWFLNLWGPEFRSIPVWAMQQPPFRDSPRMFTYTARSTVRLGGFINTIKEVSTRLILVIIVVLREHPPKHGQLPDHGHFFLRFAACALVW